MKVEMVFPHVYWERTKPETNYVFGGNTLVRTKEETVIQTGKLTDTVDTENQ